MTLYKAKMSHCTKKMSHCTMPRCHIVNSQMSHYTKPTYHAIQKQMLSNNNGTSSGPTQGYLDRVIEVLAYK